MFLIVCPDTSISYVDFRSLAVASAFSNFPASIFLIRSVFTLSDTLLDLPDLILSVFMPSEAR